MMGQPRRPVVALVPLLPGRGGGTIVAVDEYELEQELRAALRAHADLGEAYEPALVRSFMDKVDREVDRRVVEHVARHERTLPVKTNRAAIVSFVLALLVPTVIGPLLALVFGGVALHQIDASRGRQRGRGLAIAGLVIGVVGLVLLVFGTAFGASHITNHVHPIGQLSVP